MVEETLDQLSAVLPGLVLLAGDPGWDQAMRRLVLAADEQPAAVVTVADEEDVAATLGWAWRHRVTVVVRTVGEGVTAAAGGWVVLDVAGLTRLVVDADHRIARVGAGVTCEELLAVASRHGLTWPAWGSRRTTVAAATRTDSVAGHTVVGVDLVTPTGERRWVTAASGAGLCRAMQNGSEGLGVVVGLDVALHPTGLPAARRPGS